jgi:hypothetical protein
MSEHGLWAGSSEETLSTAGEIRSMDALQARRKGGWPVVKPGNRHKLAQLLTCILVPWAIMSSGCGFWEEWRFNDYSLSETIHPTPPLDVLASNPPDAYKRAKALGRLKEPAQNKGSAKEQELAVAYLIKAAKEDQQAICRLEAIKTLATYKDPRAVQAIIDGYYQGKDFVAETGTVIRMQAMSALGQVGKDNREALQLLVRVVQAPPLDVARSNEDTKHVDVRERLTAARALANFKNYQATEALVHVLRTEKDVALHDAVHQSLVAVTGKKLPPDPQAWEDLLNNPGTQRDRTVAGGNPSKVQLMPPIQRTSLNTQDKPQ